MTSLQDARKNYHPPLPKVLQSFESITLEKQNSTTSTGNADEIKKQFPHSFGREVLKAIPGEKKADKPLKIGVVLSGGQAAGGHNVIAGLFDALKQIDSECTLIGFLGGPGGIVDGKYKEITESELKNFRNEGGFHLIGSGRTKIETPEQLSKSLDVCSDMKLDGLVVIGGDDSNTNAAVLAEYFWEKGCTASVVGVPKTIDGDLKNSYVDISFGFDTATKIYSEMIGNIGKDALSAKKYYHFIKLMGRSASHIALECALKIHPNLTFIAEEVHEKKQTLLDIRDEICELICKRSKEGKHYGLILVPEGLIEFIPEVKTLIETLNHLLSENTEDAVSKLSGESKQTFELLPKEIQDQLLIDRDPHGNVQVSKISTEKLLLELVKKELKVRKEKEEYDGKFNAIEHFFGYEGRSGYPSNFDAKYCYSLGFVSALLLRDKYSGYMAAISNLSKDTQNWEVFGIPITSLMNIETRKGKAKAVIQKALVDLKGKAFSAFAEKREAWELEDSYLSPGPIQFFGDEQITDTTPISIQ